jgi:hypothetical protein
LPKLNRRFAAEIADYEPRDQEDKSVRDAVAEHVLAQYDTETA